MDIDWMVPERPEIESDSEFVERIGRYSFPFFENLAYGYAAFFNFMFDDHSSEHIGSQCEDAMNYITALMNQFQLFENIRIDKTLEYVSHSKVQEILLCTFQIQCILPQIPKFLIKKKVIQEKKFGLKRILGYFFLRRIFSQKK